MDNLPRIIKTFACHGFESVGKSDNQYYGSCPFCLDDRHFYIHEETGQWDCKTCGKEGNIPTFLTAYAKMRFKETSKIRFKRLSKLRGLPVKAFKRFFVAWDGAQYLIPCYRGTGTVADIRRWSPSSGKVRSTTGCKSQLFGGAWLERYEVDRGGIVWVCEGEWDTMALAELLSRAGRKDDAVVGVPGADVFKQEWLEWFSGHHVRLCYDNDGAGDRGSKKAGKMLSDVAKTVEYLCWPHELESGYDLRDFVTSLWREDLASKSIYRQLCSMVKSKHRIQDQDQDQAIEVVGTARPEFEVLLKKDRPTFDDVVEVFSEEIRMDREMIACLRFTLAACLTEQLDGPALWAYIVGPPGSGKTLIICSLQGSDRTMFRSSLTAKCLVSGFDPRNGNDPSILAQVNSHILAIKDGTEIFSMMPVLRQEVLSILRGAHDGYVSRSFGNGVKREYAVHFTCIMGVTGVVNTFPDATMGERFLKFHIHDQTKKERELRVRSAILSTGEESQTDKRLQEVVRLFLARNDTKRIDPPTWMIRKMVPLVDLIVHMRATVLRTFRDELTMSPEKEHPTRVAKQLTKLMMGLAFVDGGHTMQRSDWPMVERVALDTVFGFHTSILRMLCDNDGRGTLREIGDATDIPRITLYRRIDDMEVLGLVRKETLTPKQSSRYAKRAGGMLPKYRVQLTDVIAEKIRRAKLVF